MRRAASVSSLHRALPWPAWPCEMPLLARIAYRLAAPRPIYSRVRLDLCQERPHSRGVRCHPPQTGLQCSLTAGRGQADGGLVTLEAHDMPLWEAMRALVRQATPAGAERWSMADPSSPTTYAVAGNLCVSGPFLISIRTILHRVDYSVPDDQADTLILEGQIFSDGSVRDPWPVAAGHAHVRPGRSGQLDAAAFFGQSAAAARSLQPGGRFHCAAGLQHPSPGAAPGQAGTAKDRQRGGEPGA